MQSSLLANDEFVIEPGPNYDYNNSNNNTTSAAPSTTRTYPIVQVIAPETLAQGYTFDVEFNHEILSVVVVRIVIYLLLSIYCLYEYDVSTYCCPVSYCLEGDAICSHSSFSVIRYHFNTLDIKYHTSAVQYSTVQYSTYSTYSTVQYHSSLTVQYLTPFQLFYSKSHTAG